MIHLKEFWPVKAGIGGFGEKDLEDVVDVEDFLEIGGVGGGFMQDIGETLHEIPLGCGKCGWVLVGGG